MANGFAYWIRSIVIIALLGASLGAMGSYWYFFWENRKMCPCAPVGLEDSNGLTAKVVQPYSDELMKQRVIKASLIGLIIGIIVGLVASVPGERRLKKAMQDIDPPKNEP